MKKEQRTKTKEQRTMSKEQRIMKKTRKKPVLSALCSLFSVNCSLLTVLCSLFIAACDVDHDFMQRIDDEIAWSNADRLNVVLSAPGSWGNGSIKTRIENVRKGYNFEVEFNTMPGFSLIEWRAYKLSELEKKGADWNWTTLADPLDELNKARIQDGVMYDPIFEWKEGEDKEIELRSPVRHAGGVFDFRININPNEQIVLVPICSNAPGIRLTHPPMKEEGAGLDPPFPPTETITIDLTAPVDQTTVRLEAGYIEILAWDLGTNGVPEGDAVYLTESGYFNIRWNAGLWRIIIEPTLEGVSVIENKMITVKLGKEIKNIMGYSIAGIDTQNPSINFSWKTNKLVDVTVLELEASYDEEENTITVKWTLSGDNTARISYTENNNERQTAVTLDTPETAEITEDVLGTAEITGIEPLAGEVWNGQKVSNIRRYNIWIQLLDEENIYRDSGSPITIYNFDGMTVSRANPTELINSAEDFRPESAGGKIVTDAAGADKNYLLTRDIEIPAHTPISNFQGNFYGNGHKITIRGMSNAANMGLFGTVDSGTVRDLTVTYEHATAVSVSPSSGGSFGGIAGTVSGGAQFENLQVTGAVTVAGSGEIRAGGLVGRITNTTTPRAGIRNSYSALNFQVNRNGYIGGIVGIIGTNTLNGGRAFLERISVLGNITIGTIENEVNGEIHVGGLVGVVRGVNEDSNFEWNNPSSKLAVLHHVEYSQGNITVFLGNGDASWVAGAIGHISGNSDIQNCRALAGSFTINKSGTGNYFFVGGFLGEDNRTSGATSNVISNCYSETNVFVHIIGTVNGSSDGEGLAVGGFAGKIGGEISYCYAKGNVSASSSHRVFAGGFVGDIAAGTVTAPCSIKHCFATGNVSIPTRGGNATRAGGFIGFARDKIYHSYALGDVFVHTANTANVNSHAGGFAGQADKELINCFAGGSVILHRNAASAESFAGGLLGNPWTADAKVQNCVVVPRNVHDGLSITVTGPNTRYVGRIYGRRDPDSNLANFSNNHAWSEIRVFNNSVYSVPGAGTTPSSDGVENAGASANGINATSGTLRTPSFWTGLGYTTANGWDTSTVGSRGYPRLARLSGQ